MAISLGRLERVTDISDAWPNEATDFTPWLAQAENVRLLGDIIGMELEVDGTEVGVGTFRADILCTDTLTGSKVLIENQYKWTDHKHLGQLITYAAGLRAVTIVWIAERFTDEHRAAIVWLNEVTKDGISFFGLEIELWRIGESPAAPKFNIVEKPNDWIGLVNEAARKMAPMTEVRQDQMDYWTMFVEFLGKRASAFKGVKPQPSNTLAWGLGRTGATLPAYVNMKDGRVGVAVNFGQGARALFERLAADRESIETELGFKLDWENEESKLERYAFVNYDVDTRDRKNWPELHVWTEQKMSAMNRVFRSRIRILDEALTKQATESPAP